MKLFLIVFFLSSYYLNAQEAVKITLLQKDTVYYLQKEEISIEFDVQISNQGNYPIYLVAPQSYQLKNNNPWEIVIDKQTYKLPSLSWCGPEFTSEDIICLQANQSIIQTIMWHGFSEECLNETGFYSLKLNYKYTKDLNYSDKLDELNIQSENEITITVQRKR